MPKNFGYGTVLTAPSPATSGTSLVLNSGQGTLMPAVPFRATIWPVSSRPTTSNAEIVTVTAVSTDTLTITRAQEGSSARTVVVGDQFAATQTAELMPTLGILMNKSATERNYVTLPNTKYMALNNLEIGTGYSIEIGSGGSIEIFSQTPDLIQDVANNWDGWIPANETWTFSSADTPTYVFTSNKDASLKYSAGMRIKFKQSGVQKYGIITAVSASTITVCMSMTSGTVDNSGFENATVTDTYYSLVHSPQGFPVAKTRWELEFTDTAERSQASPTASTWYNVNSSLLAVPIGDWLLSIQVTGQQVKNPSTVSSHHVTLSTANNTESDAEFTNNVYAQVLTSANASVFNGTSRWKHVTLTTKTTYYLNIQTEIATSSSIEFRGDRGTTVIRATLSYV